MEIDLMNTTLPMRDFITLAVFLVGIVGTYYRLAGQIGGLMKKFEEMEARNKAADQKTDKVEAEQHTVQVQVAVMATQISSMSETMNRIDSTMQDIAKSLREKR